VPEEKEAVVEAEEVGQEAETEREVTEAVIEADLEVKKMTEIDVDLIPAVEVRPAETREADQAQTAEAKEVKREVDLTLEIKLLLLCFCFPDEINFWL